jgi:hypothetical protein
MASEKETKDDLHPAVKEWISDKETGRFDGKALNGETPEKKSSNNNNNNLSGKEI